MSALITCKFFIIPPLETIPKSPLRKSFSLVWCDKWLIIWYWPLKVPAKYLAKWGATKPMKPIVPTKATATSEKTTGFAFKTAESFLNSLNKDEMITYLKEKIQSYENTRCY